MSGFLHTLRGKFGSSSDGAADAASAFAAAAAKPAISTGAMLAPLALAQFIASFAGSNMNVAISDIADDLGTTVTGVQTAITVFTLTMAALMIPGSKLSDIWGRKRCFIIGMVVYGIGTVIAALAPTIGVLIIGYSFFEGLGSAFMIPPIYILTTVSFTDLKSRAKAFGVISAAAAMGSATGPLIGGMITSATTWRLSFGLQAVVVLGIIYMSRRIVDHPHEGPKPHFDVVGAILSAAGLVFVVFGILQAGDYGWIRCRQDYSIGGTVILSQGDISPVILYAAIGVVLLLGFFWHIRSRDRKGGEPLLSPRVFKNRTSNLGLVTQNIQWLTMLGGFFVISVFLQEARDYSAIQTGLILTASTVGVLISGLRAAKMAARFSQRTLIRAGFVLTIAGFAFLLLFTNATSNVLLFLPGLFMMGLGVGAMVTASVNVVQSAFGEKDQGEISGLSRCVSNLGSSFGTAIAGAVLVSALMSGITTLTNENTTLDPAQKQDISAAMQHGVSAVSNTQVEQTLAGQPQATVDAVVDINAQARNHALALALLTMGVFALIGLGAAMLLPADAGKAPEEPSTAVTLDP
ncbi:MAG TPA: MFS transporter [Dehalococcoidia bacterium]